MAGPGGFCAGSAAALAAQKAMDRNVAIVLFFGMGGYRQRGIVRLSVR